MLLTEFIQNARQGLEALYPEKEALSLVNRLCEEVLGTKSYTHIIEPGFEISCGKLEVLEECLARLLKAEPIQYVLGFEEFYGRRFNLNPSVLIPRPETELLVAEALKLLPPEGRVLDLCTGSGCIAWSIALEREDVRVVGVDISSEALSLAESQFGGSVNRPVFVQRDILGDFSDFEYGKFDLILSNPPYIMEGEKRFMRANVLNYEPSLALFVPDNDPLVFYRAIARWAKAFLKCGGRGIVELNESLGTETQALFSDFGYKDSQIICDFFNKNRFLLF